jgi:hypothetical protein
LRYWNPLTSSPQVAGTSVLVRYEPFDMSVAYAFIEGQSLECAADAFLQVQGRSEREWHLLLDEWQGFVPTATLWTRDFYVMQRSRVVFAQVRRMQAKSAIIG